MNEYITLKKIHNQFSAHQIDNPKSCQEQPFNQNNNNSAEFISQRWRGDVDAAMGKNTINLTNQRKNYTENQQEDEVKKTY